MVCDCYRIDRVEHFISVIGLQNGGNGMCVMCVSDYDIIMFS